MLDGLRPYSALQSLNMLAQAEGTERTESNGHDFMFTPTSLKAGRKTASDEGGLYLLEFSSQAAAAARAEGKPPFEPDKVRDLREATVRVVKNKWTVVDRKQEEKGGDKGNE
ncbi:hypothetical protein F2P81_021433 [Scophthalmus maximus]|uniref:Uncharacterized protein n=1 Tax=Scophthalmus maximus TaxID=52904 RepID=A0A6A4RVC6_SCOMX|nr:hypothetical protein F2P81_021433 [Scophthalmus maximus]